MDPLINADATITHKIIPGNKMWPNNDLLPVIYYKQILNLESDSEKKIKELLNKNNWTHAWVNGIFEYPHYHSTAHEVLCVIKGSCMLQLGGSEGNIHDISAGDVVLLPAGIVHKKVGGSEDLRVIGAYPDGQECDMMKGEDGEREKADKNIPKVSLPKADPLFGDAGPVNELWLNATS